MNVSSKTALAREMKQFEVPFLSTDDPRFSVLKYQFLKYFDDWITTIELGPRVYEKSEKQKVFRKSQIYNEQKSHCTYCHRTDI